MNNECGISQVWCQLQDLNLQGEAVTWCQQQSPSKKILLGSTSTMVWLLDRCCSSLAKVSLIFLLSTLVGLYVIRVRLVFIVILVLQLFVCLLVRLVVLLLDCRLLVSQCAFTTIFFLVWQCVITTIFYWSSAMDERSVWIHGIWNGQN